MRKNDLKGKESTHGAKGVDPKVGATYVEASITPGSAHRTHRVQKEERQKGRIMHIHHRDSGRHGTQDSVQSNGRT